MDFWEGLTKIEHTKLTLFLMVIFTVICPGILIIFFFKPALFISLPLLKLIFLAISFTAPIYLINQLAFISLSFFSRIFWPNKEMSDYLNANLISLSCLFTLLILIPQVAFEIIFHRDIHSFFNYLVISELVGLGIIFLAAERVKQKNETKIVIEDKGAPTE